MNLDFLDTADGRINETDLMKPVTECVCPSDECKPAEPLSVLVRRLDVGRYFSERRI